ncbi:NADH-FMN oxidoreductase RutF, flavin reductase (DIM6/NTAB) family [Salinibacillus kushneri]|uniref:NADH-FMN oxidoreductase RutF, flavin reductase (DIM6/NTAB) family n=1 Tax=Salinibacillus kushneri TaxID=237682 RepID=A0A1I0IH79_9BACI|nr:flavin reductase family protein [Salinibacillus kushneri]SET96209.1 NADH-FMN oxidoreductase RutF, flavin reductase (DIM6/NTAB) family [Salinibacillus kushneri]
MDNREYRKAMGKFATGITVITGEFEGAVQGMTVNAFMSVSLNPRLITISIDERASMYEKLQNHNRFGVSVLSEEQKPFSMIFAKQIEKDREIPYEYRDGVPVIKDSLVSLSCSIQNKVKAGDHMLFIAEVTDVQVKEGSPILFYNSEYRNIKEK